LVILQNQKGVASKTFVETQRLNILLKLPVFHHNVISDTIRPAFGHGWLPS